MTGGPDVLVVGAGPTGLTTALQAHDNGATVRVVERRPLAFRRSRAMVVHSGTLASLHPLGVTAELLDRAGRAPRAELHLGRRRVSARLADAGRGTAFPHLTVLRQMDVEEVLTDALRARGVEVERGVEFVGMSEDDSAAHVLLRRGSGHEAVTCRFVAACDGPDSTGRRAAGIEWRGAPYREQIVIADAELDGDLTPDVLHVVAARQGLVFLFAPGEGATWRILATRAGHPGGAPFGQSGHEVPITDVQGVLDAAGLGVTVRRLAWSGQVRVQHRLAASFRRGRLFLAGDAAHAHSPAAAQGMNTGILDAVNLGWKLAFAGAGRHAVLLDSYEQERRPVARMVIALTHLVFIAEASTRPLPALLRGTLIPLLAPVFPPLLRQPHVMAPVFGLLSQRWVRYRHSRLSVQGAPGGPGPRPGDRLPEQDLSCDGTTVRSHELIAGPGVHVLLAQDTPALDETSLGGQVTVHRVGGWTGRGLVAVRPDGHVGFRCGAGNLDGLTSWLDTIAAR